MFSWQLYSEYESTVIPTSPLHSEPFQDVSAAGQARGWREKPVTLHKSHLNQAHSLLQKQYLLFSLYKKLILLFYLPVFPCTLSQRNWKENNNYY